MSWEDAHYFNDAIETSTEERNEKSEMSSEPTLLEKAISYRRKHSEQWENRVKDKEVALKESFGVYEKDSFLDSYYRRIDEIVIEKKNSEKERKLKSPQIEVQIQFNAIRQDELLSEGSSDSYESSIRRASGVSTSENDARSEYDIFEPSSTNGRKSITGGKTEMLITITKGKYLLNWLESDTKKYKTCTIKCMLFPKSRQTGNKLKTRATYVNMKGTARYHHIFKLHGFSADELAEKYVVLEVTGKNKDKKEKIGRLCLSGNKAVISDSNSNRRGPTFSEYEAWQEAIQNPGSLSTTKAIVHRMTEDFYSGNTGTSLSRSGLSVLTPSKSRPWSRRSPVKRTK